MEYGVECEAEKTYSAVQRSQWLSPCEDRCRPDKQGHHGYQDMYINACTYNIELLVYRQDLRWDIFCFLFTVCVFWMPDFRINWGGGRGVNLGIRPVYGSLLPPLGQN
jgi:hypothetical protein